MVKKSIFILVIFSSIFSLSGCITPDVKATGFTKIHQKEIKKLDSTSPNQLKDKPPQYFLVVKLKSVNDQPLQFLEFKGKRFKDKNECENWMIENRGSLNESLHNHVSNRKRGYFVDNIKCLRKVFFVRIYGNKASSV